MEMYVAVTNESPAKVYGAFKTEEDVNKKLFKLGVSGTAHKINVDADHIGIDLGFTKLVADKAVYDGFKEISIGLENEQGYYQDIVVVGNDYEIEDDLMVKQIDGRIVARVFASTKTDDYTDKFVIEQTVDEEKM